MKTKLTMMVAMAAACVAIQLAAMPTAEETRRAEPVVKRMLAQERAALESGKKTRSEVAAAAMKLADEADTDAAKLLLMKGAFVLYVRDGNLEKAVKTMKALEAAIPDIPQQNVSNMIEAAFLEASKKKDVARLYKLLGEKRGADFGGDLATKDAASNVEYKFSYKLEGDNAVITGINPEPVGTVVIPDKIDGHLVTAFQSYPATDPFQHCDRVTKVVLPAGMNGETFDPGMFTWCKSLSCIEVSTANKDFASRDGVLYSKDFSTLFVYPKTRESVKLSPKTRKVKRCAFRGCALKTAKMPEGITEMEGFNFSDCPNLEIVEFPKSITYLGCCVVGRSGNVKKIVFNGDKPRIGGWRGHVFAEIPADLVVEVRRGTKGWKSPDSIELPERWPVNQSDSRPIRYIDEADAKSWAGMKERQGIPLVFDGEDGDCRMEAAQRQTAEKARATLEAQEKADRQREREQQREALLQIQEELRRERQVQTANAAAEQRQATVNGYTWSYRVRNGEATIMAEKDRRHSCAVSPTPKGKVTIPQTLNGVKLTRIGWEAFRNCKGLTSVTIPEGVTHIDGRAFDLCDGLKAVKLPSSLKVVGFAAFGKCAGLTSVVIPEGVTSIGNDAFNGCSGLKNVVIPNSVTNIGERAFLGCQELTSVTIPAKVASIGEGAFVWGDKLKQINLAADNQSFTLVDGVLYKKDMSVLLACLGDMTSVTIPSGVTKIGAFAFRGCTRLKSVTIPEGVTDIGWVAFVNCEGLKSLTLPSSVKVIGPEAFKDCVELDSVTMRGERPDAPNNIFQGCGKLKSIHVPANAKSWAGMKDWFGIPLVFDAK